MGAHPDADGLSGSGSRPTILFDKDGTLIEDVPYNVDPPQIRLAPGAAGALRRLGDAGFAAAVITNQSGVARGYFPLVALDAVRDRVAALLAEQGVELRAFYACPHLPIGSVPEFAHACDCRKPGSGLVRRAVAELGLVAEDTWMVGDSWADVGAGCGAGCRTILVGPEAPLAPFLPPGRRPDAAVPDLASAIEVILEDWRARLGQRERAGSDRAERDATPAAAASDRRAGGGGGR